MLEASLLSWLLSQALQESAHFLAAKYDRACREMHEDVLIVNKQIVADEVQIECPLMGVQQGKR